MDPYAPIAVVGYSYRAPSVGRKGLWDFLQEARSAFSHVPSDRFDQKAWYSPNREKAGTMAVEGAHFLPGDIYAFDAPFFNMNKEEVTSMDPQHRMMLECGWEAMENAGISASDLTGSNTGVFAAIDRSEYLEGMTEDLPTTTKYTAPANSTCMFSNRLSYFFDLHGPSISVDAACSSSLYAIHLACQSLRMRECDAAFSGGASLIVNPNWLILLDTMGALSPDGKSYSYDHRANGFGVGEGAGCLVLKRFDDAIAAGDPIRAVIRNTSANHSGRTRGITMPSQPAQEELLRRVHHSIGLDPSATTFVEGHGTGTQVGDPIDAGAIANVLGHERSEPVYIGSVKSNFGHLLGASGMLAMIKAIMMVEKSMILPNANFEELSSRIDGKKVQVAAKALPWPQNASKRVCITNFGFGGSNAVVLLDEPPSTTQSNGQNNTHTNGHHDSGATSLLLFPFSAKSDKSLHSSLSSILQYLQETSSATLRQDLSFTLQRRTQHSHRVAFAANSIESLKDQMKAVSSSTKFPFAQDQTIGYVFTGQGAQYAAMAQGLSRFEAFDKALEKADTCLRSMKASWSIREELAKPEADSKINEAQISQPACTAIQLALVALLRAWGIAPSAVTGHSSGEIAAAYTAGFISFETAIAVAFFRGRAVELLSTQRVKIRGAMLALGTDADSAELLIEQAGASGRVVVAAINSPQSVTVSGDESAVEDVEQAAKEGEIFARRLKVDKAYHSHHMEQVAAEYQASIEPHCSLDKAPAAADGDVVYISSVTGRREYAELVSASSYWRQNLVRPVRFLDATMAMLDERNRNPAGPTLDVLVEIGPHAALKGPIAQTLQANQNNSPIPAYLASLVRGTDAAESMLSLAGRLHSRGADVDIESINRTAESRGHLLIDLPAYEWNKTARYKHETRHTSHKANPGHPYSSLLGWKSMSDGREHTFRQILTTDEIPWLEDHKVAGEVLFPFTGYLSLAVDAFRSTQQANPATHISVTEIHIKRVLKLDAEQKTDVTTKLRPAETSNGSFSLTRWNFDVLSWTAKSGWISHCHGQIEASPTALTKDSPGIRAASRLMDTASLSHETAEEEYGIMEQSGIVYGPTFKRMTRMWLDGAGKVVHECEMREGTEATSPLEQYPVTADAPTLDCFLQSVVAVSEDGRGARAAYVPTYISRLRISNNISATTGDKFTTVAQRLDQDSRTGRLRARLVIFDSLQEPCMEVEMMTMERVTQPDDGDIRSLPEGYVEDYVPHVDLVGNSQLSELLADRSFDKQEVQDRRRKLDDVATYFLHKAIGTTKDDDDLEDMPFHLSQFLAWAKRHVDARGAHGVLQEREAEALVAQVSQTDAAGELLCAVGAQLVPILRGELEPLEVMLKDGLLQRHYEADMSTHRGCTALARYIGCLAEAQPEMKILEIGAGTGSATLHVLESLSDTDTADDLGVRRFANYVFTDISSGFFEAARKKLSRWPDITYQRLDISQDPAGQGFALGTFDLVIATNVLHATADLTETMANVRSLLKPQTGKIALLELMHGDYPAYFPFCILPGWWLAEDDYRTMGDGPLLSQDNWQRLLHDTGFSGIDGIIHDFPGSPDWTAGAFWSTRVDDVNGHAQVPSTALPSFVVCGPRNLDPTIAKDVANAISTSQGQCSVAVQSLDESFSAENRLCIFIDNPHHSYLADLKEHDFSQFKSLVLASAGLLWVIPAGAGPSAARIKGVLRCVRQEDQSKLFLSLEGSPSDATGASVVARLAERLLCALTPAVFREQEFAWQDGMIQVPRVRRTQECTETFAIEAGKPVKSIQKLQSEPDNILRMTIAEPGDLDSIFFERHTPPPLQDDEVLVRVMAGGINFRDVLVMLGKIPWTIPGGEGAGIVIKTGSNVHHVSEGDKVFYSVREGAFATWVRVPALRVSKMPPKVTFVEAASMPVAYGTALMCLDRVARLQKGESVLIHAGAGAVGQACIRIAQHIGAEVFATAGSTEKRAFVGKTFGIPATHIHSSRTADFREAILARTNGKGVDVVVNSLSGDLLQQTWSVVAEFGRFIEIGKVDFLANSHLGMRPFDRNVAFIGVDLLEWWSKRPSALQECLVEIVDLTARGVIGPIQGSTLVPISKISEGFRKLQSGTNIGKVVAAIDANEEVLAQRRSPLVNEGRLLRSDATYLITGGTGGIGRSLVPWFLEHGASNIVLLGRSAESNSDVVELRKHYDGQNGNSVRAIACDVSSSESLRKALAAISDLPPVRGVIHGALFMRDAMFANSTFQDWTQIGGPKVDAAWHLHELLPGLDFWVSLASASAQIGNAGQSIYCGTSTFLGDFAKYRNDLGLHTVAIDLPIVRDVGYVAQRDELQEQLGETVQISLSIAQVHTLIKGAIMGPKSGVNRNGNAFAFVRGDASSQAWREASHYLLGMESPSRHPGHGGKQANGEGDGDLADIRSQDDVLAAVGDKVSSITMIEREEVTAERNLMEYGLDSLVAVELRNWIRRRFGLKLALTQILAADNLQSLAADLYSKLQRGDESN